MDNKIAIINLIVIGHLETGMKLNTRNKIFEIDEYNWYQGLSRLYRRDNKIQTIEKIEILVNYIIQMVNSNVMSEELDMYKYIEDGINGLIKLQQTYEQDITTKAKLQVEIEALSKVKDKVKEKRE